MKSQFKTISEYILKQSPSSRNISISIAPFPSISSLIAWFKTTAIYGAIRMLSSSWIILVGRSVKFLEITLSLEI